ncbi:MAG TPA: DUF5069 domain-containing protein [Opitutaceae bacterium]
MNHFTFPQQFRALYDKAVGLYAKGQRGADTFFTPDELTWLAANGINAQHMYDYAEDHNGYGGEPGFEHALSIEIVRRDYFLNIQKGKPSATRLDDSTLPAKTDAVRGIAWLPRMLPKARAKLRGELPPSLMYCCGGDRRFLKEHNILPAEFLAVLWRNEGNDAAVVDWVLARSGK